ncbi:phage tail protein I [Sphingomonas faeni]|uniref:phage tail protein I n=1 Tax=Sphingomonas faeni TaxID=185950 RepID=UPI0020C76D18|nr:phage tail protein I [Sphingomonas faeni]MCP8893002.1 phage tail protein I [Sphingomonas faeni]
MTNSLLPPNATPFERALEAGGARIVDVATPADLDDPMTCPVALLPWLAWGLSVDTWDADWSEQDKRAAVADSIALHRRKGTRTSVETVLGRFDQLARLIEWHEATPRRPAHTFDICVPMVLADGTAPGGRRASAAFADAIIREVSRVKPLREHLRLVQEIAVAGAIGIEGAIRATAYTRTDADMIIDTSPDWAAYLQTEDGEPIEAGDGSYLDTRP